jgi:prevent-host-death family protein
MRVPGRPMMWSLVCPSPDERRTARVHRGGDHSRNCKQPSNSFWSIATPRANRLRQLGGRLAACETGELEGVLRSGSDESSEGRSRYKELKDRLTYFVKRTKEGEKVIVTDRGTPDAILHSLDHIEEKLAALARRGLVTLPRRSLRKFLQKGSVLLASLPRTAGDLHRHQRPNRAVSGSRKHWWVPISFQHPFSPMRSCCPPSHGRDDH